MKNAIVVLSFLLITLPLAAQSLTATTPPVCPGVASVTGTLDWSDTIATNVYVNQVRSGQIVNSWSANSGSTTAPMQDGDIFQMFGIPPHSTSEQQMGQAGPISLASTPASISASPATPAYTYGTAYATTTISYSAPNCPGAAVYIGSPTGALFAASSPAKTGNWVTNGITFYLVDRNDNNYTLATVTVPVETAALSVQANPIMLPYNSTIGSANVSYSAPGYSNIDVRVGSAAGQQILCCALSGWHATGNVIGNGTALYLVDENTGIALAGVTVGAQYAGFSANPQTIDVPLSGTSGSTTLSFNAPGYNVSILQGGANVFSGANSGSYTASGVTNGTVFSLLDSATGITLAQQTVNITNPTLTANPNPVLVGSGVTTGSTTLTYNAPGFTTLQLHTGSATGPLVSGCCTGISGSVSSGLVPDGTLFVLTDGSGTPLQQTTVHIQPSYALVREYIRLNHHIVAVQNAH